LGSRFGAYSQQSFVSGSNALAILSDRFGQDMSAYDLDGPIPDIALPDSYHSFASVMLAKARRESMTLRDLYNLTAAARSHWVLCGSAERIADTMQHWFDQRAADGFNVSHRISTKALRISCSSWCLSCRSAACSAPNMRGRHCAII
jgi:alkanesulfonate monooxygenase SsuD/methylene tetrahydromethanopterin reductase-like flavin-dependent oxidoreductase (luciferase family)